jgi:hypothetical protein
MGLFRIILVRHYSRIEGQMNQPNDKKRGRPSLLLIIVWIITFLGIVIFVAFKGGNSN